jgi:hypothetical protein
MKLLQLLLVKIVSNEIETGLTGLNFLRSEAQGIQEQRMSLV